MKYLEVKKLRNKLRLVTHQQVDRHECIHRVRSVLALGTRIICSIVMYLYSGWVFAPLRGVKGGYPHLQYTLNHICFEG